MWTLPEGIFEHTPPREANGELDFTVGLSGGKSIATSQYHYAALKLIRAHYLDDSGQVYYTIVNPGGGYVGGDAYRIALDVEEHASVLLTDQSAAKVYRTPDDYVVQNIDFSVARGAVLEYIPDQMILYRDADFRQKITADVDPEGSLFMSDIITPGWSPDGGQFLYKQAFLRNEVRVGSRPVLVDNLRVNPLSAEFGKEQDFYMGGRTHISTIICVSPEVTEDVLDAVRAIVAKNQGGTADITAALSATQCPGFVVRALGNRTEELMALITDVANHLRREFRGQPDLKMRKY